jgi:hypothetical protein
MVLYASADQIARAIVAAARLTGADPLRLYEPSPRAPNAMSRARWLAYAALSSVVKGCANVALARGLGIAPAYNVASNFRIMQTSKWWREDWVDEVVGAILAPEIDLPRLPIQAVNVTNYDEVQKAIAPDLAAPAAPASSSEENLRRHYRPARKPKRSAARALDLGEPVSGRSALDQRRAGVTPHYGDDDDDFQRGRAGCIRKPISLPRLKFLEKDF